MSSIIEDEASEIVDHIGSFDGKDFLVDQPFNVSVFNVLWRIVSGKRYKATDPQMIDFMHNLQKIFKKATIDAIFPWLRLIAPGLSGHTFQKRHSTTMKKMFSEVIEEHKDQLDMDSKPKVHKVNFGGNISLVTHSF